MHTLQGSQTRVYDAHRGLRLPILSPYFQTIRDEEGRQLGRNIKLFLNSMAYRVIFGNISYDGPTAGAFMHFVDTTTNQDVYPIQIDLTAAQLNDPATMRSSIISETISWASGLGITITAADIVFPHDGAVLAHTVSNPTRALNTAYQVSANTLVIGSVEIDATLSLTGGTKGTVTLEYADDSAFTTNVKTASVTPNGNTGTLTIGLNTSGAGGGNVVGYVPASKYYKFVTASSTGTATFTMLGVQEITL